MDRYRKQGMEYRFHDDAGTAVVTGGTEVPGDKATGAGDEPGAPAHDDGHPTDAIKDAS